jgi:lipopolysaccharide biosynthesis protein
MKSVIIYTYFQSSSSEYNLSFFVKTELSYKDNIDYIIVINGHNVDSNIHLPEIDNLTVIRRDNVGYDFGGHNCALEHIKTTGKLYDYFFFMNSGVIGPIIPHYFTQMHWTNVFINKIDGFKRYLIDLNDNKSFNLMSNYDLLTVRDEILGDLNKFLYLLTFK